MKYKIKWESNIKVKENSEISSSDIVKNLNNSLNEKGVVGVRLHDMRKKYPAASIFFSDVDSSHTNGGKAHTHYSRLIAHVDTSPESLTVEFSSEVKNPLEIMKVIGEIVKIIQCQEKEKKPTGLPQLVQG